MREAFSYMVIMMSKEYLNNRKFEDLMSRINAQEKAVKTRRKKAGKWLLLMTAAFTLGVGARAYQGRRPNLPDLDGIIDTMATPIRYSYGAAQDAISGAQDMLSTFRLPWQSRYESIDDMLETVNSEYGGGIGRIGIYSWGADNGGFLGELRDVSYEGLVEAHDFLNDSRLANIRGASFRYDSGDGLAQAWVYNMSGRGVLTDIEIRAVSVSDGHYSLGSRESFTDQGYARSVFLKPSLYVTTRPEAEALRLGDGTERGKDDMRPLLRYFDQRGLEINYHNIEDSTSLLIVHPKGESVTPTRDGGIILGHR